MVDFLWENCTYLWDKNTKEELREAVLQDLKNGCIIYTDDEKGLTGVCRFSVFGTKSRILDVAVRQDNRGDGVLNKLLRRGLEIYPMVEFLEFNSISKNREFSIPVTLILAKEK